MKFFSVILFITLLAEFNQCAKTVEFEEIEIGQIHPAKVIRHFNKDVHLKWNDHKIHDD
jgi:hypothetical protein